MDLYDFYSDIVSAVAQDADLVAWAAAHFDNELSVYAGMPSENFPDMTDDTPFVLFGEPTRSCSQNRRTIVYGCEAWMGLAEPNTDQMLKPDGERHPTGIELILDGMRLVRLAVVAALPDGVSLEEFDEAADANAVGSEVHGAMVFSFLEILTIGQDPMA